MRISDWSSDVCSSDLGGGCSYHWHGDQGHWPRWRRGGRLGHLPRKWFTDDAIACLAGAAGHLPLASRRARRHAAAALHAAGDDGTPPVRSEEHTSELQSLMRISYAVLCLKKKKTKQK